MFDRLKAFLAPPETKSSRTAKLLAFESGGRARWTPRDYAGLAREGYLANAIVHRSVRLIAENAAACTYLVFEGAQEREAHPLSLLLTRPNPRQDGGVFFEMLYAHLLLAGNAYVEAVALDDQVRELYALRPDRMKVVPGADGWAEAYEYSVGGRSVRFDQLATPVPPILHLTFFHPLDDHYGLAPIEAGAVAVDAAIQIAVLDLTRTAPPSSPTEGQRHVVATGATGAWASHANAIATWQDGAWAFLAPKTGWCIWSSADDVMFVFDGALWRDLRDLPVTLDNAVHVGVNTTASSPNLLSVKSNAALLSAINVANGGSGDVRLQLCKESAAKTASVFFSDAFSGRAEFGLTGDDNFHLKVSPDGSAWSDALVIDKTSGKITLLGFSNTAASRTLLAAAPIDALAYSGMQVNGAMEVSQENGTTAVTLTATGTLQFKYLLDGVMAGFRGSFVAAGQQVAAPSGMPAAKALKVTVTTAQASLGANDELSIVLPVEGVRTSRLLLGTPLASPQSLGFWFSAHRTGLYSGSIMNAGKTRACPFSFTVAAADTPQWISLSGANALPSDTSGTWANDTTVGMTVSVCLAGGSSRVGTAGAWATTTSPGLAGATSTSNGVGATSDVFYVSNVIALPGLELPPPDRAPLIMRPFDQELTLCQRYFRSSWDTGTAPGTTWSAGFDQLKFSHPIGDFSTSQIFPAMRTAGTLTIYDAAGTANKVTYFDNSLGSWANNGAINTTLAKQNSMFVQHTVANSRFTNFGFKIDARL